MTENCRFVLDGGRYVIDLLNPANSGKAYCHEGDPEDDIYLRERVLMALLDKRLAKLIHDGQPKLKEWRDGKEYQPYNHDQHAVWWAILSAILASHLNTFDPKLSVQHKFDGTLKRKRSACRIIPRSRFLGMMSNVCCAIYMATCRVRQ